MLIVENFSFVAGATQPDVGVHARLVTFGDFVNPDGTFYPYDPVEVIVDITWSIPENTTDLSYTYGFDLGSNSLLLNRSITTKSVILLNKTISIPVKAVFNLTYISPGERSVVFWVSVVFVIGNNTVVRNASDSVSVKYVDVMLPKPVALYPTLNNTFILLLKGVEGRRIVLYPSMLRSLVLMNNATSLSYVWNGSSLSEVFTYNTVLYENVFNIGLNFVKHPVSGMYYSSKGVWLKVVLTTKLVAGYMPVTFIVQVRNSTTVENVFLSLIPYAHEKALMSLAIKKSFMKNETDLIRRLFSLENFPSPMNSSLTNRVHVVAYDENGGLDKNAVISVKLSVPKSCFLFSCTSENNIRDLVNIFTNDTDAKKIILEDFKNVVDKSEIIIKNNTLINTLIPFLYYNITSFSTNKLYNMSQVEKYGKTYNFRLPQTITLYYPYINNITINVTTGSKTWSTGPHPLDIWNGEPLLPVNLHGIPVKIEGNTLIIGPESGGITTIKHGSSVYNFSSNIEYGFPYGRISMNFTLPYGETVLLNSQNITRTIIITETGITSSNKPTQTNYILILALSFLVLLLFFYVIIEQKT
jgi:hypothetical protein